MKYIGDLEQAFLGLKCQKDKYYFIYSTLSYMLFLTMWVIQIQYIGYSSTALFANNFYDKDIRID